MYSYKAPLRDIDFIRYEVLDFDAHYRAMGIGEFLNRDAEKAIIEQAAKFAENTVAPLNAPGDVEGCHWADNAVTTPKGYRAAFAELVELGWPTLTHAEEFGGQGMPDSLGLVTGELLASACWAWSIYPGLGIGAVRTIEAHGSDDQKKRFIPNLVTGAWTGTMCLTEPHCGSDLGLLTTKAVPQADGSYQLHGTKIFITGGDNDLGSNIVHIVLARIVGAPAGTRGISLFVVPKFFVDANGNVDVSGNTTTRNGAYCSGIEHKSGNHGSATCTMQFEAATGYLIGEENRGLNCMFTFINHSRLKIAMQGLAHAEAVYQLAAAYAKDRKQGRALKNPSGAAAEPLIVHADIRRMLLTVKAFAEGSRALTHYCAQYVDWERFGNDEQRANADHVLALLTPIAKAFMTDAGIESIYWAMQVFGGHGYIRETGIEQHMRDARIATVYEGTNGIQALDLLARKVLATGGKALQPFVGEVLAFCDVHSMHPQLAPLASALHDKTQQWVEVTGLVGAQAIKDLDAIGAAAVDYLNFAGYVVYAYMWLRIAVVAQQKIDAGKDADGYYDAKVKTAQFYFERLLPRTASLRETMLASTESLMALRVEQF